MKLPSWTRCWSRYWTQCWPGQTGSCFCRINEGEEFQGRTVRLCRHVPNKHNQAQLRDCNLAFSLCPQCQGPPACGPKTPGVCPRRPGHARWGRDPRRWPDPPAHRFDYPFPDPGSLGSPVRLRLGIWALVWPPGSPLSRRLWSTKTVIGWCHTLACALECRAWVWILDQMGWLYPGSQPPEQGASDVTPLSLNFLLYKNVW